MNHDKTHSPHEYSSGLGGLAVAAQAEPLFESPILLTSAGQSVDIKLAGVLLSRLKIEYTANAAATAADLEGVKTLLIVPGYSSKGLGAAGISRDDELARVKGLLAAAKEAELPILVLHLGGKARRGVQSDDFNAMAVEASRLAIVVAQGDEDGFFTDICKAGEIPLEIVKTMAEASQPLSKAIVK